MELFNLSFELSEAPCEWKIAKVTPLPKDVYKLRPNSLIPLPLKLIEKIVQNRIYTHCNDNNLLDPKQGGFRPEHSTISTLLSTSMTKYFLRKLNIWNNRKNVRWIKIFKRQEAMYICE